VPIDAVPARSDDDDVTSWLLERAREIDPPAWASRLSKHLERRRDLSMAQAFKELLAARKRARNTDPAGRKGDDDC
jgi:hypothetical protein